MKVIVKSGDILAEKTQLLVLPIFEKEKKTDDSIEIIDKSLDGEISFLLQNKDFTGESKKTFIISTYGKLPAKRIMLLGMGKRNKADNNVLREVFGTAALKAKELKVRRFTVYRYWKQIQNHKVKAEAYVIIEGAILALYSFNKLKTGKKEKNTVSEICLFEKIRRNVMHVRNDVRTGKVLADAANYTRDLQFEPSNEATPGYLEEEAKIIASENNLKCTILEKDELKKLGLNLILSVAKGSHEPPKLIILEYKSSKSEDTLALVGKGITFDSGGISIKPSKDMDKMKYDMSGGAVVLGAMKAIGKIQPALNIIGIIPAAENLPGGLATKPGDVIRSYSGKTVEILNTDAEGRLILADALAYVAKNYNPDYIIDFATLTGACVVALGQHATGLMGNNRKLIERIKKASVKTGEKVWELPLWKEYSEQLKSDIADLKNIGGKYGGAITAGAFLQEFVGKIPWAHLDIAGTAYDVDKKPLFPKGPTGAGTRLILELIINWEQGNA